MLTLLSPFDMQTAVFLPHSMDKALQHRLLTSLSLPTSVNQRVVIEGTIRNPQEVEHLKQWMSPSVECVEAIFTSEMGTCIMVMNLANSTIEHDGLDFVVGLQCLVYHRLESLIHELNI